MVEDVKDKEIKDLLNSNMKDEALTLMLQSYTPMLYGHVKRMVNEDSHCDDILQNTFLKAWKYLDSFKQEAKVSTWLFKIASNEAVAFINKEKKVLQATASSAFPTLSYEKQYTPVEIKIMLQEAIGLLPAKQRQVFVMRYYDEMPYKDMSELLETSESALKSSYHFAVKKIENYLKSR